MRTVVITGAGGTLAAAMLAAAGPASAQPLTCGTTLTASVTLAANLDCTGDTTGNALTIGAAGLTVNLNGHKILGPGDSAGTEGIVDDTYSGLTVENGTISDFSTDVDVEGASGSDLTGVVVRHLTTTDDAPQGGTAVNGEYLDGASIHNLSVSDAGYGVLLIESQGSNVSHNHMTLPGYGIIDSSGDGDFISGNSMSGVTGAGIGLYGSSGDDVRSNIVTGVDNGIGIVFELLHGAIITRNVVNGLYTGIFDSGNNVDPYATSGNTVSHNTGSGDGRGLYALYSADETYVGNTFSHGEYGIDTDYPFGATLRDNITDDNSQVGVFIYTGGQTGGGLSATLTRNTADGNRFGLYSEIPTSGSGNHAAHNKVVNCYHVSCTKAAPRGGPIAAPPHRPPPAAPALIPRDKK